MNTPQTEAEALKLPPRVRDRIMSLHRRAYDCPDEDAWWALAERLDCPRDARDQFWRTVLEAKAAGMTKEQAFPLAGEVTKYLSRDCRPGDLVWWRNLAGEIEEAELVEVRDGGVAVVRNRGGEHAVLCDT